jgi:hypothetical protein
MTKLTLIKKLTIFVRLSGHNRSRILNAEIMPTNKQQNLTIYKRGRVQITGHDRFAKLMMLIDLISSKLFRAALFIVPLYAESKMSLLEKFLQWIKQYSE